MPRDRHPLKKKHPNRSRPAAIIPLSDEERLKKSREAFAKALQHLMEAERLANWGEAPNACVHSAYYAMHHAASAAILASGGVGRYRDAPHSHEHVIEHFGKLVAGEAGPLGAAATVINHARIIRVDADYGPDETATAAEASDLTLKARIMLDAIRQKWSFAA
jgi:uncharacterized protein (UPF0332 family)